MEVVCIEPTTTLQPGKVYDVALLKKQQSAYIATDTFEEAHLVLVKGMNKGAFLATKFKPFAPRKLGLIFQPGAWWFGVHYSPYYKRFCITLIPTITLWIIQKGGTVPARYRKKKINH